MSATKYTESAKALRKLARHLEDISAAVRSHGGHGLTYDEEVTQLKTAAKLLTQAAGNVHAAPLIEPWEKAKLELLKYSNDPRCIFCLGSGGYKIVEFGRVIGTGNTEPQAWISAWSARSSALLPKGPA